MRFTVWLLLFILITELTMAQKNDEIDSLEQLIASTSGESKVDVLFKLGWIYKGSDTQKSNEYLTQTLEEALKIGYKKGEADAYNGFGALAFIAADYELAQSNFEKALTIRLALEDQQGAASLYNNIAIIRGRKGDLSGSLEYYLKATKLRENTGNDEKLGANYLNIGVAYNKMGHYDLSEEYFKKALELGIKMGQQTEIGKAYNGLGNARKMKGDIEGAIEYFKASLDIKKESNDKRGMAITYNNLGDIYRQNGSIETALNYFVQAKELNEELHSNSSLSISLEGEAICRLYLNQPELALNVALRSYEISSSIDEPERIENSAAILALIYSALKDFEKSNMYRVKSYEAKKKYFSDEMKDKIAEMQTLYETEKKEQENELLRQQKASQDLKLNYQQTIILISVLGLLLMSYLIYQSIKKGKELSKSNGILNDQKLAIESKNEQLQKLMEENNLLMNIVAHDLKSPINNIQGLTQIIELELGKADVTPYLNQIKGLTTSANHLISDLSLINKPDIDEEAKIVEEIDIYGLLNQVLSDFKKHADDKNIEMQLSCDEKCVVKGNEDMLRRVMDNLISNALKFSKFETTINVSAVQNGDLKIAIQDQGPGISEEEQKLLFGKFSRLSNQPTNGESSTGLGLAIVKRLIDSMGYGIQVQSELKKGTTFTVVIPKSMILS